MEIQLRPVVADEALFAQMEKEGLIRPLNPLSPFNSPQYRDSNPLHEPKNLVATLYSSDGRYGGHKLIRVQIQEHTLPCLISHPEPEDFILLGNGAAQPMVIVISKLQKSEFEQKCLDQGLTKDDFYCFYAPMNDPTLSIFTMNANYPHAELLTEPLVSLDHAPTFFVTESTNLPEHPSTLEGIHIDVIA